MKFNYLLILATVASFSITSCLKDTCNGALGNTFEVVEYDSVYLNVDSLVTLHASLTTLEVLPASYFEDVVFLDEEVESQINSITVSKTNLKLTLSDSLIPAVSENVDLIFNFIFGDRTSYIDCQHSGSSDAYFLELSFNLKQVEENEFEVTDFDWNEIFAAGHL